MTQQIAQSRPGRLRRTWHDFTTIFADPRFYAWAVLLIAGFAYVASVLCGRANPFHSRHPSYADFAKLLATLPFLFFLGPRHNLSRFSEGWRAILLRNGLAYAFPFFLGLNWYYLQSIDFVNYSLTPGDLARMPLAGKAVFAAGGLLIIALAIYHARWARQQRILLPYTAAMALAILTLATISYLIRADYSPHIHHYFFFGFFVPWARFRHPVSLICQAFCAGVYVEGISEWSMALLWTPKG